MKADEEIQTAGHALQVAKALYLTAKKKLASSDESSPGTGHEDFIKLQAGMAEGPTISSPTSMPDARGTWKRQRLRRPTP